MLTTVEGMYRNGTIELTAPPDDLPQESRVLVTFLAATEATTQVDLRALGIDAAQAAELRAQLASFATDWDSPEMDVYDHHDTAKDAREAR